MTKKHIHCATAEISIVWMSAYLQGIDEKRKKPGGTDFKGIWEWLCDWLDFEEEWHSYEKLLIRDHLKRKGWFMQKHSNERFD